MRLWCMLDERDKGRYPFMWVATGIRGSWVYCCKFTATGVYAGPLRAFVEVS